MERYKQIIPDWEQFLRVCRRPQPTVIRANLLRTTPEELAERLERKGFSLEPLPWSTGLFTVTAGPYSAAKTVEHWAGLFYIQEAAAVVPALALDARPGEYALDLSAAPGGKTSILATAVGPGGMVVANDPDGNRRRALLANLQRLGHLNVVVTPYDGRRFPSGVEFQRVLVDAPCSAEGNVRRTSRVRQEMKPRQRRRLVKLQTALLQRGLDLLARGGSAVYATCTFDPEENEGVVSAVMEGGGPSPRPVPPGLPAGRPGITRWRDREYDPSVTGAVRLYPHDLDSGGMFFARFDAGGGDGAAHQGLKETLAPGGGQGAAREAGRQWEGSKVTVRRASEGRLRRTEGERGTAPGAVEWTAPDGEAASSVYAMLRERFGLPEGTGDPFRGLHVYAIGRDLWISSLPALPPFSRIRAAGLSLARGPGESFRPTSRGAVIYGHAATRNTIPLNTEGLISMLEGRRVPPEEVGRLNGSVGGAGGEGELTRGYVILKYEGLVIGLGYYDDRGLRSALTPARSSDLLQAVRAGAVS